MIFRQITHDDLGCASYLIGDEDAGVAAVVDPKLEIERVPARSRATWACAIEHILETHNHADHVSGHGRLAAATGATIHIHRDAAPDYEHEPFDDGWELELGARARARAAHARPPARAHGVRADRHRARRRAVGGADRRHAVRRRHRAPRPGRRQGARARAASSTRCTSSCSRCPTTCEVWPGHLGGSLCGGPGMDMKVVLDDRLRARATTSCSRVDDEDEFVERDDRRRSARSRRTSRRSSRSTAARCARTASSRTRSRRARSQRKIDDGALVVDVRTELQFDEAHIPGAVCNPARAAPASARSSPGSPTATSEVVLVGRDDDDARARRAARRRGRHHATSPATSPAG